MLWAKEFLRWLFWYPFRILIQNLPFYSLYLFSSVLAYLSYFLSCGKRHDLEKELSKISPIISGVKRRQVIRDSFFNHFQNDLEMLVFPRLNAGNIGALVEYSGLEELEKALLEKRGVILVFAHFGANQMIMPALGYKGYRMFQISAPPFMWKKDETPMKKAGAKIRWQHQMSLPAKHINVLGSMREAVQCLKSNGILNIALDGGTGKRTAEFDFMGRKVSLSTSLMKFAARTGCPVLPTFMISLPNGKHRLVIEPGMGLREDSQGVKGTQAFLNRLEEHVAAHPSHYLWFLMMRSRMAGQGEGPFFKN